MWSNGEIVKNVGKHLTKEGLRDIIHKERSIELCFEGKNILMCFVGKRLINILPPVKGWNTTGVDPEQFLHIVNITNSCMADTT